jgi:hypothetical protein
MAIALQSNIFYMVYVCTLRPRASMKENVETHLDGCDSM